MQFLSRLSCNSKIARVNKVRFQCDLSPRYRTGFRTCLKLVATLARQKLHRVAATKIACVNGPLSSNLIAYQSCETSLIGLVERWKQAVNKRNVVGVLSTDMSKAFDWLHPPLLINKLRAYGFSDNSLALMRSYFCLAPPYITDLFVVSSSQCHLKDSNSTIPKFRTVAYGNIA